MSTPVFVCGAAVAEVAAVEEDVSLIATAEAPRTVEGKVFTPPSVLVTTFYLNYDGRQVALAFIRMSKEQM